MPAAPPTHQYRLYCAPLAVMIRRLEEHAKAGGILAGLKFVPTIRTSEVMGDNELPALRVTGLSIQEQHAKGAPRPDQQGKSNTPQEAQQTIQFTLYTRANAGFIKALRTDPGTQENGHADWMALIMDALETDPVTNSQDSLLEFACERPFTFRSVPIAEEGNNQTIESAIIAEVYTKNFCRGARSAPHQQ